MKIKTPDKYTAITLIFGVIAGFGLMAIGKTITRIFQIWIYQN
jgi:hypothetical protein